LIQKSWTLVQNPGMNLKQRQRKALLRFVFFLAASVLSWTFRPWIALGLLLFCFTATKMARKSILKQISSLSFAWIFILFPLLDPLISLLFLKSVPGFTEIKAPLFHSISLFSLLTLAQWLGSNTSAEDVKFFIQVFFSPLGRKVASQMALLCGMTLCFLPLVFHETSRRQEALALRCASKKIPPWKWLTYLASPLLVSLFCKIKNNADALKLRGSPWE